jgi:23S rRNA pseudouridine2605 synthase
MEKFNITKYIARCGVCSRKDAEEMVLEGRVKVNDRVETDLTRDIDDCDSVMINGMNISFIDDVKLYMLHKPRGCIVSKEDDQGRKTIFDLLPKSLPRLMSVGRLDFNSEGLILLTNYGPLARYFELPDSSIERVYEVKLFGNWEDRFLTYLRGGIKIDGFQYRPMKIKVVSKKEKQIKVECILTEGKNLELRKIFKHLGFLVSKLKRVSYGHFHLGQIPQGAFVECKKFVVDRAMKEAKLVLSKK